jgi:hypothetical protein
MYHSLFGKVDCSSLKPGLITLAFVFAGAGYAAGSQLAGCREDIASPQDLFGDMNLFA